MQYYAFIDSEISFSQWRKVETCSETTRLTTVIAAPGDMISLDLLNLKLLVQGNSNGTHFISDIVKNIFFWSKLRFQGETWGFTWNEHESWGLHRCSGQSTNWKVVVLVVDILLENELQTQGYFKLAVYDLQVLIAGNNLNLTNNVQQSIKLYN